MFRFENQFSSRNNQRLIQKINSRNEINGEKCYKKCRSVKVAKGVARLSDILKISRKANG